MFTMLELIKWAVWEPMDTAQILEGYGSRPMTNEDFDIVLTRKPILMKLFTSRYGSHHQIIEMKNVPITCRNVLFEIQKFYMARLLECEIPHDDDSEYAMDARKNIVEGRPMIRLDLVNRDYQNNENTPDKLYRYVMDINVKQ